MDFFITPEDTNSDEISEDPTAQTVPASTDSSSLLASMKSNLESAVSSGSIDVGSPVLGMQSSVISLPNEVPKQPGDEDKTGEEEEGVNVLMVVGIVIGVLGVIGVAVFIFMYRKLKRMGKFVKARLEESPS